LIGLSSFLSLQSLIFAESPSLRPCLLFFPSTENKTPDRSSRFSAAFLTSPQSAPRKPGAWRRLRIYSLACLPSLPRKETESYSSLSRPFSLLITPIYVLPLQWRGKPASAMFASSSSGSLEGFVFPSLHPRHFLLFAFGPSGGSRLQTSFCFPPRYILFF